jgi:sulfite exporter TauE/SafE
MTPPDASASLALSAAFVAGIAGSAHCVAMCGGLAGALGMRARVVQSTAAQTFVRALLMQLGRIGSYSVAGALVGALAGAGSMFATEINFLYVAQALRLFAGLVLLAIAVRIAFAWNAFAWIERAGARFWSHLAPMTKRLGTDSRNRLRIVDSLLLGAIWGWLPCGLVYSMLLFAAANGDAARGAAIMIAFGFGTLPAMLVGTLLAAQLTTVLKQRSTKWVAAALLAAFGVWTLVAAISGHHH